MGTMGRSLVHHEPTKANSVEDLNFRCIQHLRMRSFGFLMLRGSAPVVSSHPRFREAAAPW